MHTAIANCPAEPTRKLRQSVRNSSSSIHSHPCHVALTPPHKSSSSRGGLQMTGIGKLMLQVGRGGGDAPCSATHIPWIEKRRADTAQHECARPDPAS